MSSGNGAKQIVELINSTQQQIAVIASSMYDETQLVVRGVETANQTGEHFDSIEKVIGDIITAVENVAGATVAMTRETEGTVNVLESVAAVPQEAAAAAEEVFATSEEQSANMLQIADASQQLNQLSERLYELVNLKYRHLDG